MADAWVEIRVGDARARVPAGGIIGRSSAAAFPIADDRVSEAHAMVSLRQGHMYLLALRGSLILQGAPIEEVLAHVGLRLGLCEGFELEVCGLSAPLDHAGMRHTIGRPSRRQRLLIVARFDVVHIHVGTIPHRVVGRPAQMLTVLAEYGCPVEWTRVAREIWRDEPTVQLLRRRWDRVLGQLRSQLERAGVRLDLVASDGKGLVELNLHPGDAARVEAL